MSERANERTNEPGGAREQSRQCGTSELVRSVSVQANGRASGPVFPSRFMAVLNHSALIAAFALAVDFSRS